MTSVSVSEPALRRPAVSLRADTAGTLAVVVFFFVFYSNLAVVLTRFHGVPQIIASSVVLLLLVPIVRALIVERQPLVVTPVLPLVLDFSRRALPRRNPFARADRRPERYRSLSDRRPPSTCSSRTPSGRRPCSHE